MVEAAARYPGRRSSPWILTAPQRRFSRASRTINATSSSGIGGRPGGLGWLHFAAAMRRCQRGSVVGADYSSVLVRPRGGIRGGCRRGGPVCGRKSRVAVSGSGMGEGNGRCGQALAIPWYGRWVL
jgi:hypothetical protein